ncbi:Hypothetical protein A7982_08840 [Minicystis rosea]|nr:Hypothetical protein A7982_08840 [Minicystis rosea]
MVEVMHMKHWIKALGTLSLVALGACSPIVLDPLHPETSEDELGSDPDATPPDPSAIAMRLSQVHGPSSPASAPFNLMGNPALESDAIVFFFASKAQACEQPVIEIDDSTSPAVCAAQAFWQAAVAIPADLVVAGATIDLGDDSIGGYQAVWMAACGGGGGGGPGSVEGTLEIVSVSATSIEVQLTVASTSWGTQSGAYTASICP